MVICLFSQNVLSTIIDKESYSAKSEVKTFAAAARPFSIGIIEHKFWLDFIIDVVHFGSNQKDQSLRIDNNPHIFLFHQLV